MSGDNTFPLIYQDPHLCVLGLYKVTGMTLSALRIIFFCTTIAFHQFETPSKTSAGSDLASLKPPRFKREDVR